ncbi:MAG: PAS domain-containing protein [Streptomyces sp.]|uniref:response regulator n=1 Tax=Streptomyces sp. TaxID=1931 RepID=UPI003D6C186C
MSSRPSRGAARLAAILDALPDALLLVNCNGTVVNANTIALEMFETAGTALVGRGLLDLLPEFDSKRIPGSMRRPDEAAAERQERQRPTRMVARRTDGSAVPVEVTSANLEDARTPYASAFEAAYSDHGTGSGTNGSGSYTGDELLMLVVRDLTGTLDTEQELARQQRQTEMILRAASEGVVGVDTEGRIVLVNPAAAQILGYRAGDLGGQELHPLVLHSRPDGSALPYEETTLSDTLKSGRKHRVRAGQVLWAKDGHAVPVDITTAPVRDGEQLVGAVVTFTDRRAYESLTGRHQQLMAVLGDSLRGPLDHLRDELAGLAADPAGQLWPEANQILHHLAAGYARMTTLVDNVLGYQRLDAGRERLRRETISLDGVVANGVEGAVELIGPGRAQFAVHAPPIEAEVDSERLATALAHLIADVAGVDATGKSLVVTPGVDSTIVVAAAQRGDVVRIEVRGPYGGGSPVHEPIVRGIVEQHGGVLQTHEVPGAGGSAYVLEVPVSAGGAGSAGGANGSGGAGGTGGSHGGNTNGAAPRPRESRENETTVMPVPAQPVRGMDAPAASAEGHQAGAWTSTGGAQGGGAGGFPDQPAAPLVPAQQGLAQLGPAQQGPAHQGGAPAVPGHEEHPRDQQAAPTGRRRGRPSPAEGYDENEAQQVHEIHGGHGGGRGPTAGARPALELPAGSTDVDTGSEPGPAVPHQAGAGRRARRTLAPPVQPGPEGGTEGQVPAGGLPGQEATPEADPQPGTGRRARRPEAGEPEQAAPATAGGAGEETGGAGGRRARRLARDQAQAQARAQTEGHTEGEAGAQGEALPSGQAAPQGVQFAAPPSQPQPGYPHTAPEQQQAAQRAPQQAPQQGPFALPPGQPASEPVRTNGSGTPAAAGAVAESLAQPLPEEAPAQNGAAAPAAEPAPHPEPEPEPQPQAVEHSVVAGSPILGGGPLPPDPPQHALPMPGAAGTEEGRSPYETGQGPCVRTLGQGVPFVKRIGEQPGPQSYGRSAPAPALPPAPPTAIPSTPSTPPQSSSSGRRRRLAEPPRQGEQPGGSQQTRPGGRPPSQGQAQPAREFTIGAPAAGAAEGPEPLDGPDSPVEVSDGRGLAMPPRAVDDELPPEPLDNPRRLLVWPEPDPSTQQALSNRGYRPVIVHSREEVDAQIAAYPAALFVDPLTGPITRTALQSLRTAAVAAEVPVLVTSGLGQATREAAYGADPAVLLKALAPRDSEQHPPRVLLVEEHPAIAGALAASLERRGMQVAHAPTDADAVNVAAQTRPNLVVMDLMQVRRRRAGIIDWLRVNGLLNRTPFVVYTSADMDPAELPRLTSGETVLFLAERSTSTEVQSRIVDLLTKIGAR